MSGDSGWSAVIHHPSELELQNWNWEENDGEQERELPSTVDMDAIKGGGSWDPATEPNGTDSVDSEEDSDSDDESSGGTEGSCSYSDSNSESDEESSNEEEEEEEEEDTASNTDCTSEHSEQTFSIQETNFEPGALKLKITMKGPKKEDSEKVKCEKVKKNVAKKAKGNCGTKSSECSSDDSDSSDARLPSQQSQQSQQTQQTQPNNPQTQPGQQQQQQQTQQPPQAQPQAQPQPQQQQQQQQEAHQPLQEINQEDLAAILPDQDQEDAPFDGFEDSESGRLVSKAIERMSLGADSDTSENTDQTPVPVYSSTLLQQFVEKTALLSEPRKRRSKATGKKTSNNETTDSYPCASNVSPDSGIQSVDNSPLHLAVSPVSPQQANQSPVQAAIVPKPAVNVDRVLYPPKRKPGRPAKTVSTQPRGPGRPRLKPEIAEKIEKIEKAGKAEKIEKQDRTEKPERSTKTEKSLKTERKEPIKPAKEETAIGKRGKGKTQKVLAKPKEEERRGEQKEERRGEQKEVVGKRGKERAVACQKKRCPGPKTSQEKTTTTAAAKKSKNSSATRVKCLSRSATNKCAKGMTRCDGRACKKSRREKPGPVPGKQATVGSRQVQKSGTVSSRQGTVVKQVVLGKQSAPVTRQKQLEQSSTEQKSGKRSLKENRSNATTSTTRKPPSRKPPPATRRVLKENKNGKKSGTFETNGVGVQTLISLPVGDILKAENVENVSRKCDKATQPIHNHCRKHHHHHKHRRRLLMPPKHPIRVDPCIVQELEKLVEEFARACSLGRSNPGSGYSELPQIFRVKKLSKKRKGESGSNEEQKMKRRLKKEKTQAGSDSKSNTNTSTSSNPNEQRLPLKKRHYHVSSPHSSQSSNSSSMDANANESNSTESHIEEAIEATITRYGSSVYSQEDTVPVTPKKRHRDPENGSPEKQVGDLVEEKPTGLSESQPRRKKKILKDLRVTVTKLTSEGHGALEKTEKPERISTTGKAHHEKCTRSEKLSERSLKVDRPEKMADLAEQIRLEKCIKVDTETVDAFDQDSKGPLTLTPGNLGNSSSNPGVVVLAKKKIRRRKAINRTGFPTLKKKKKKRPPENLVQPDTRKPTTLKRDNNQELDSKTSVLNRVQDLLPPLNDYIKVNNEGKVQKVFDRSNRTSSSELSEPCSGQLRVRKDLVESGNTAEKLYPVKFEKLQDTRVYDENASLEESFERYSQGQRIAELNEENLRKLERANSSIKMELSGCLNNNHKRRRGSASPCNLTPRNLKRLRSAGYDTENDGLPGSDLASDDHESGRHPSSRKKQSRWKKRYLQRGIFDYGKDYEARKVTNESQAASKGKIICEEPPASLLSASYQCGKLLRQRKVPFQLPYDLWWLHTQSRLPGRDVVPSWNYKKIRTNIYYDVKPTTLYEAQACECKPESGCGDDCINRMVFSECSPQFCPCGEKCENQRIQKHDWAPGLQKFMTEDKGWGVRTQQAIKTGDFILEYVGEVVSEREFKSRMATRYANDTHHYCLHLDGGLVIDGHRMGGDGRFVNHSCEPNCEMQKWSVHGLPRMALFASRDIKPGEELTYDYNFALFNPSEGQQCRCGSSACRGVIGGKSQRVQRSVTSSIPSQSEQTERRSVGRPRKNVRKSNTVQSSNSKGLCKSRKVGDSSLSNAPVLKPMSHQQRCFAQQHHCFLLRNLEKVRRLKSMVNQVQVQNGKTRMGNLNAAGPKEKNLGDTKIQSDAFYSQLTALTSTTTRTVRTRRLAQAQDDPEVHKTAKLAKVLKDLYTVVATANDENGQPLCAPFVALPPKRKVPDYYEKIPDPIDLTTIEQCIGTGHYKTAEHFDHDLIRLFDNNVRFFGRTSEIGIAAARLRKLYLSSKPGFVDAITEATGQAPSQGFLPPRGSTAGEEDVIRCICGLHRDEGLMIQCERCLVWQHCDCVKADTSVESYLCERCNPRPVDLEIPLEGDEEEEGKRHYVTLLRGDLQLRQGDTVYVLRDTPEKHTYKTIQKPDYEQMDIFRIERLWKNAEGERFVFGHHYLRPHETYHEPTRKFYENEVVCAPLYEAVPCDLVAERCWVLDPHTYCKGRPVGSTPEHTYVCEYRVDRAARLFTKVARARHQVCTKPYAFETFPQRIKHYRTYLPHSLDGIQLAGKTAKEKKKNNHQESDTGQRTTADSADSGKSHAREQQRPSTNKGRRKSSDIAQVANAGATNVANNVAANAATSTSSCAQREEQRRRLNGILVNLLQRMPNKKDPLDLSFLLERNRRNRKRPGGLNP